MTLAALRTHIFKPFEAVHHGYENTCAAVSRAWRTIAPPLHSAVRAVRSGIRAGLAPIERTLLSAAGRERIHAVTVFTLIFAFAVTSIDFLVTGGPDFSGGAPRPQQFASAAAASPISTTVTPAPEPVSIAPAPAAQTEEAVIETAAPVAAALEAGRVVPVSSLSSTALPSLQRITPRGDGRAVLTPIELTLTAPAAAPALVAGPAPEAVVETAPQAAPAMDVPAVPRWHNKKPH